MPITARRVVTFHASQKLKSMVEISPYGFAQWQHDHGVVVGYGGERYTRLDVVKRNPKTGEEVPITARRVVTFHASQKLKSMVEHYYDKQR